MTDETALLGILEDAGLSPTGQTRKSWVYTCPRCDGARKLYVRKRDGRYICWSCAKHGFEGRPEFLLAHLIGVSVEDARRRIYGSDGPGISRFLDLEWIASEDEEDRVVAPEIAWPFSALPLDHPHAARGVAYLEGRGIPKALGLEYGLRYSAPERRVYIPVEEGGRLVGWQARLTIPNEHTDEAGVVHTTPKILSSPDIPRDRVLMFGDRVGDTAVVTEGPFDALKCHLVPGAVATMGKAVSPGQLRVLRERGVKRIYLALDPDAAHETMWLARELWDREVFLVEIPPGWKDLGEMTPEAARDAILGARRLRGWELILQWG